VSFMKVGDMVKHPKGMVNVSEYTYSCGLIIETEMIGAERDQLACLVLWRDFMQPMKYSVNSLVKIS